MLVEKLTEVPLPAPKLPPMPKCIALYIWHAGAGQRHWGFNHGDCAESLRDRICRYTSADSSSIRVFEIPNNEGKWTKESVRTAALEFCSDEHWDDDELNIEGLIVFARRLGVLPEASK